MEQPVAIAAALRGVIAGDVITPGDRSYEQARRVWYGVIDRSPAVIARCSTAGDVVEAVQVARNHDIDVAIRGGGHEGPGSAVIDDGLVIDLSSMTAVTVDPSARRASASEHPDLFWATRGAGRGIGVVTSVEFDLRPLGPEVAAAQVMYGMDDAASVVRGFRDLAMTAPETVSPELALWSVPRIPRFPRSCMANGGHLCSAFMPGTPATRCPSCRPSPSSASP